MNSLIVVAGIAPHTVDSLRAGLEGVEIRSVDQPSELAHLQTAPALLIVGHSKEEGFVAAARQQPLMVGVAIYYCASLASNGEFLRRLVHDHGVDRILVAPLENDELTGIAGLALGIQPRKGGPGTMQARMAENLRAQWKRFKGQMLERVADLEVASTAMSQGSLPEGIRRQGERQAHKLAGALGTFGLGEGSRIARELELTLGGSEPLESSAVQRFAELTARLRAAVEAHDLSEPSRGDVAGEGTQILVMDSDPKFAERLVAAAADRHITSVAVTEPAEARTRLLDRPSVAIIELAPGPETVGLIELLATTNPPVGVVALGSDSAVWEQTNASRSGVGTFLRKPVAPEWVIAEAERLARRLRSERGRVLALDDDPQILAILSDLLGRNGFEAATMADPLLLLDRLEALPPDLLIIDVEMPHLSGIDLCRLVRGDPRWHALPILVLTIHRDTEIINRVFRAGADDVVTKPIIEAELLTRIANRLERARLYRSMAETDFLTGIPNRRKATELIEQLRRVADRHKRPLSFAILDIDHFKRVNDRFGHATGDRVLRRLADFLVNTFRGEDVVGRWGGEEFVLGMYSMSRENGLLRLRRVLDTFRAQKQEDGQGGTFSASFSAGLAEYPADAVDLQSLYRAADAALYRAKAAGRARVRAVSRPSDESLEEEVVDVLVVDDDDVLTAVLVDTLQEHGYRTLSLTDGREALEWLDPRSGSPGARLVLLDVDIPGLNGLEVLRQLQKRGLAASSRVVMLTARSDETIVLEALRNGAFDHIGKPISVPVLIERVKKALEH